MNVKKSIDSQQPVRFKAETVFFFSIMFKGWNFEFLLLCLYVCWEEIPLLPVQVTGNQRDRK